MIISLPGASVVSHHTSRFALLAALLVPLSAATSLGSERWTFALGATSTCWKPAAGIAGHTEDCRTPRCDTEDFVRGNLDSSFGYRFGAERTLARRGWLSLCAGADLSLVTSEYNLSQRDVWLGTAAGFAGVEGMVSRAGLSLRGGGGPSFTDDGRTRSGSFVEAALELPLPGGAGLRYGYRETDFSGATLRELAVLMVARNGLAGAEGSWDYSFLVGFSEPADWPGRSLSLSRAPLVQNMVHFHPGLSADRLGITWSLAAHESRISDCWSTTVIRSIREWTGR